MKNAILKCITAIIFLLFLISGSYLDSQSMLPFYICFVCIIWLSLFAMLNINYINKLANRH
jgi:hypothetical protein